MRRYRRWIGVLIVAAAIAAVAVATNVQAGRKVYVGSPCNASKRRGLNGVKHSVFDRLLKQYVDERGLVDYATWSRSEAGRHHLDQYLAQLGCVDLNRSATREAVLAYWINLYNALTIEGILREYPTSSIRKHTSRLFGYNVWSDLLVWVDGDYYSLDRIEHEVLRPMGEPRIHFAIVCAAMGCPKLRRAAYRAERIDEQLTANAKDFFSQKDKFRADVENRVLYLSPILRWYGGDFGQTVAERLKTIAPYLPDESARQLAKGTGTAVHYLDFDWTLNDQKLAPQLGSRYIYLLD